MDTITLSKAKSELRIGRDRLVKLLKDCQIEVIQVNAQRKEITLEQLEHLRSIIASGTEATPYQNPTQVNSGEPVQLVDLPPRFSNWQRKPSATNQTGSCRISVGDVEGAIE